MDGENLWEGRHLIADDDDKYIDIFIALFITVPILCIILAVVTCYCKYRKVRQLLTRRMKMSGAQANLPKPAAPTLLVGNPYGANGGGVLVQPGQPSAPAPTQYVGQPMYGG